MTVQQFYEILGDIDEKAVRDAEKPLNHKKRLWLKRVAAMAACFALLIGSGMILRGRNPSIPNHKYDDSSEEVIAVEQKDVCIYYVNGDELTYKAEYLECIPEKVFDSWKKANDIGDEVKLIGVEIKNNGQESIDSSIAAYSVGDQFIMEVTLTQSIQDYFSLKPEEKLMESLQLTLTGYGNIDYDEFHVLYE